MTVLSLAASNAMVQAGKARLIAVTGTRRLEGYSDVPTVAESGLPRYKAGFWVGLLAPAGTPRAIVEKLNVEVQKVLKLPDLRLQLQKAGFDLVGGSPEQFAATIDFETKGWGDILRQKNIKLN